MPLPIVPIVIGFVVLAAAGRRGKKNGGGNGGGATYKVLPLDPSDDHGQPCHPGDDLLVWGAYDEGGTCQPFWNQETREILAERVEAVWAERGSPAAACDADEYDELNEVWIANPTKEQILAEGLGRTYGVEAQIWPPKQQSPYWVSKAWQLGIAVLNQTLCGHP